MKSIHLVLLLTTAVAWTHVGAIAAPSWFLPRIHVIVDDDAPRITKSLDEMTRSELLDLSTKVAEAMRSAADDAERARLQSMFDELMHQLQDGDSDTGAPTAPLSVDPAVPARLMAHSERLQALQAIAQASKFVRNPETQQCLEMEFDRLMRELKSTPTSKNQGAQQRPALGDAAPQASARSVEESRREVLDSIPESAAAAKHTSEPGERERISAQLSDLVKQLRRLDFQAAHPDLEGNPPVTLPAPIDEMSREELMRAATDIARARRFVTNADEEKRLNGLFDHIIARLLEIQ